MKALTFTLFIPLSLFYTNTAPSLPSLLPSLALTTLATPTIIHPSLSLPACSLLDGLLPPLTCYP